MKANVVLDDCRRALNLVEGAHNDQDFRVYWVALIALLRAVGHVLDKVDANANASLRRAVDARWAEWRRDREKHRLFWDFIEYERNSVLKTYELGVQSGDVDIVVQGSGVVGVSTLDECLFKPLLDGPFAGEDGRDVAREAITWWEGQLSEIAGGRI
ncbi:MAG TPA: hypothetical protein PKG54_06335 [Phycisphaerae bacterium]|jgi:hypothetical protein|nr:hypothetical protein [Phycisphaerae bacterium]HOB74126.1 hypothetical protein [Phycisphaerae bacterium]HOM53833.1 hypothetical protein [Phycisphaerae bacterium]HPP22480.1 hypothetical protein [Phycisphaerae bacterium]HPU31082.1 hypothetical protein [Phycisphaerae bacterium]